MRIKRSEQTANGPHHSSHVDAGAFFTCRELLEAALALRRPLPVFVHTSRAAESKTNGLLLREVSLVAFAERARYADLGVLQLFIDRTDGRTLAEESK